MFKFWGREKTGEGILKFMHLKQYLYKNKTEQGSSISSKTLHAELGKQSL